MTGRFSFRLDATELVLTTYLVLTGIFMLLYLDKLPHLLNHILFRIIIICIMILLNFLYKKQYRTRIIGFIRLFLPLLLLGFLYRETDYMNNLIFHTDLDGTFSKIELILFGFQPALKFAEHFDTDFFAEIMYFGYFSYYLLIAGIPLYFYINGKHADAEWTIFMIVCSLLAFYLIFIIIPVAGPQFYFTGMHPLPKGFMFGPVLRFIQHSAEGRTAAFPSSHAGICLILVWISYRKTQRIWIIVFSLAVILLLSTVYIRAHYSIDIIAAILITPMIYIFSRLIYQKLMKVTVQTCQHAN